MPECQHKWLCADRPEWLICAVVGCNTMNRIDALLYATEQRGMVRGRYDLSVDLLKHTAMLTRKGRTKLRDYVERHPITREQEVIKARQVPLLPRRIHYARG